VPEVSGWNEDLGSGVVRQTHNCLAKHASSLQPASSLTGAILFAATEVSAWSEDLGGGVVRQTVMTPHARAVDGTATAVDLSHGQRPPVRNSMQAPCGLAVYLFNAFGLAVPAVACPMASAPWCAFRVRAFWLLGLVP